LSYTSEIKSEISQNQLKPCCVKAQLAALMQCDATLTISNQQWQLHFKTENPTTAKRFWLLLKQQYNLTPQLAIMKKVKLKKNYSYVVLIKSRVKEILEDLQLMDDKGFADHVSYRVVKKECCARAFLAGAFLASGSVNSPINSNYHLEIALNEEKFASFVIRLMKRFDLPAKMIKRRNQYVVYLKASDKISDFLRAIAAYEGVMKFEDIRIQRDFTNSLTRLDNCEVANEMKTLKAATIQIEAIEYLQKHDMFELLNERLKEVALLRQMNPEASLNELSELYQSQTGNKMSKSGMKHRFNKIMAEMEKLQERLERSE
jgi:DNA-binding protein WhiA